MRRKSRTLAGINVARLASIPGGSLLFSLREQLQSEFVRGNARLIGTLDQRYREVTIVGAGIAGMLAAYSLDQRGYHVTLLEQKQRGGGLIKTTRAEHGIAES